MFSLILQLLDMGIEFNTIIAEGLVLFDPDSYIKCCDYGDIDGMNDNGETELYNKYKESEHEIVKDCYYKNSPIFIYNKNTVIHSDIIYKANWREISYSDVIKGNFSDNDRPCIVGKKPCIIPLELCEYDDSDEQQNGLINEMLDTLPWNDGSNIYELLVTRKNLNMNKMRYGKFVFTYYT